MLFQQQQFSPSSFPELGRQIPTKPQSRCLDLGDGAASFAASMADNKTCEQQGEWNPNCTMHSQDQQQDQGYSQKCSDVSSTVGDTFGSGTESCPSSNHDLPYFDHFCGPGPGPGPGSGEGVDTSYPFKRSSERLDMYEWQPQQSPQQFSQHHGFGQVQSLQQLPHKLQQHLGGKSCGGGYESNVPSVGPMAPKFQGAAHRGGGSGGCRDRNVNMRDMFSCNTPDARTCDNSLWMRQHQEFGNPGGKIVGQTTQIQPRMAARQQTGPETMKSQLQALSLEDPAHVFIVRRINKLGFASSSQLRYYFSRYGEVKSVYVSHSRVKSLRPMGGRRSPNVQWRLRAAALGFVVMRSSEAIQFILQDGPEHDVNSVMVRVHPFHRRNVAQNGEAETNGLDMDGAGSPAAYGLNDGIPLSPGLMYVSEQDLQDAMPAQYED